MPSIDIRGPSKTLLSTILATRLQAEVDKSFDAYDGVPFRVDLCLTTYAAFDPVRAVSALPNAGQVQFYFTAPNSAHIHCERAHIVAVYKWVCEEVIKRF